MPSGLIIFLGLALVFVFIMAMAIISRYRMCPPDRILVVYGKLGSESSSRCYHGGATFVMPFVQSYGYLDLTPISIDIELRGALSSQNIRIDAPASFTIGVSTEPTVTQNAATRLLGRTMDEVKQLASEIIMGQMRVVFASMTIEEINGDREKLIASITKGVEVELHKVGLRMINGNIRDIKDQSGYIDALGKEAAAKAINDAQIRVAQENQRGATGRAEAERDQAIRVASAQAEARKGQNTAQMVIARSDADLAAEQAEASRRAEAAKKVAEARALQESYKAEQEAELARADREMAAQKADQIVKAEIEKERVRIDSEAKAAQAEIIQKGQANAWVIQKDAEAEGVRRVAEGEAAGIRAKLGAEASGIQAKLTAEAEGTRAILDAKAQGFEKLLRVADDTAGATQLLIAENIVRIAEVQAGAIKGLTFEKVVVMGGGVGGAGGAGAATNGPGQFVNDLYKGVLPLNEIAKSVGLNLPAFLGTSAAAATATPAPDTPKADGKTAAPKS
ncbi:flotillin family protein [Opitutaceae bacterium TAV4]|uniref:flotillin family protein n=1 Tax=Geminisphaera colitermitum TaxID=1148786 RepID=UPI00019650DE|nr:flotillin family protein [Geminisphaera colitermitum]RRJ95721.1 flotillin family protein [Opitutaceae bacterium TAV4]RRJ99686.1 flotillin family protein [Opitutaceae bacterium TAV3]